MPCPRTKQGGFQDSERPGEMLCRPGVSVGKETGTQRSQGERHAGVTVTRTGVQDRRADREQNLP